MARKTFLSIFVYLADQNDDQVVDLVVACEEEEAGQRNGLGHAQPQHISN